LFEAFSTTGFKRYVKQARKILDRNWTGRYTRPSPSLYPHQWNWDSGFVAMGVARYNPKRAMQEIRSLFAHQWDNGMVPQIVFNPDALGHYFPEPDFWQVPGGRPTSGITMPPLHAIACLHVYRCAGRGGHVRGFLEEMFSPLMASHRYLYRHRDPEETGLVYIRHPWESGMDNSPNWDKPLRNIEVDRSRLPRYERKDLQHGVPRDQRPSDDDYDRYVFLVDLFRRNRYDEERIYKECPFLIQDVLFNSILCRANRDLIEIGKIIGRDVWEAEEWLGQTAKAISERMWSSERKHFGPIDLVTGERLSTPTAAGFMPLFAVAASREQARHLYGRMDSASFCALRQGNCFAIPNYDMSCDDFDSKNYWRGPVWVNINWMLAQGLKSYGYREKSDAMKKDMIQLPVRFGFHEYFDSITGQGYGSPGFSWTAALFVDLVSEYYERDRHALNLPGSGETRRMRKRTVLNDGNGVAAVPTEGISSRLMVAVGDLKAAFYDMERGRVDYRAMKGSPEVQAYRDMAGELHSFDPESLTTREERLAFWINLYNSIVVHAVVELGVSSSVREVSDFFARASYRIGNDIFSLDEIEHGILRANARPPFRLFPPFGKSDPRRRFVLDRVDPRIHFALVCGSRSCAPIRFYEASAIEEQLETAAWNFVNSSEVVILPEENKILLSQIFQWYARDFGGRNQVLLFVLSHLDGDDKAGYLARHLDIIKVEYLFYDWNLNH